MTLAQLLLSVGLALMFVLGWAARGFLRRPPTPKPVPGEFRTETKTDDASELPVASPVRPYEDILHEAEKEHPVSVPDDDFHAPSRWLDERARAGQKDDD